MNARKFARDQACGPAGLPPCMDAAASARHAMWCPGKGAVCSAFVPPGDLAAGVPPCYTYHNVLKQPVKAMKGPGMRCRQQYHKGMQ